MNQQLTQHRTQIYLPEYLYFKAKKIAQQGEITLAEVMRNALEKYSVKKVENETKARRKAIDGFMQLAGMGEGPKDLAANHDNYW